MQALRLEADEYAKKILEKGTKINKNDLEAKHNTTKKFKRAKHSYLKQSQIDYCVNNDLDVTYLYDEMDSKYKGGVTDKKNYYVPRGTPRGRPKENNNEQEQ